MSITHSDGIFPVFRWVRVCLSFLLGNIVKVSLHFFSFCNDVVGIGMIPFERETDCSIDFFKT